MTDKLPPHNIEAEENLLGSILCDPKTIAEAVTHFPAIADAFYDPKHRIIFEAILDLEKANQPIDIVGLAQLLNDRGQLQLSGGHPYLSGLHQRGIGASVAEYYAGILQDQYIRRESIRLGVTMQRRGYEEGDAEAIITEALKAASDLSNLKQSAEERSMRELAHRVVDSLEKAKERKQSGKILGVPMGIFGLDKMLGGLRGGQLVIVAARPGFGKTSMAMNAAEHAAIEQKVPTAVFSLEMSDDALTMRMACSRARVDSVRARDGELDEREEYRLAREMPAISNSKLRIYPLRCPNINVLASIARRAKAKHGIGLIIVDYLQLVHGSKKNYSNRVAEITEVSGTLKTLAMELDIPILCPAQLNRANDKDERAPRLSDLRDSGSIEQDADVVIFLHPSKGADVSQPIVDFDGIIAKQREGRVGTVPLKFQKVFTRFEMGEQPQRTSNYEHSSDSNGGTSSGRRRYRNGNDD